MDKDNCYEDDFKSLITRCWTYLKKADFENGNLNKISRKKSCRNNIERSSTEFQDKWQIDSESCKKSINLQSYAKYLEQTREIP